MKMPIKKKKKKSDERKTRTELYNKEINRLKD